MRHVIGMIFFGVFAALMLLSTEPAGAETASKYGNCYLQKFCRNESPDRAVADKLISNTTREKCADWAAAHYSNGDHGGDFRAPACRWTIISFR
jgi:hypothetical protein